MIEHARVFPLFVYFRSFFVTTKYNKHRCATSTKFALLEVEVHNKRCVQTRGEMLTGHARCW